MDIKEAANIPAAEQAQGSTDTAGDGGVIRRRLLSAGVAGVAGTLLPWLQGRAAASGTSGGTGSTSPDDDDTDNSAGDDNGGNPFEPVSSDPTDVTTGGTTGDSPTDGTNAAIDTDTEDTQAPTGDNTGGTATGVTEPAESTTTTTAPPRRPTEEDIELLAFAQSLELTVRDLYDLVVEGGVFDGASLSDISAIREAHEGYGTAIAGAIGKAAPNERIDGLFDSLESGFSGDAAAVAAAATALEDDVVATHIDILGQLVGVDAASLLASIVVIESRISVLLKTLAGATDLDDQLATDGEPIAQDAGSAE